jgi:DNA polymerase-4
VRALWGVGPATFERLNRLGVRTVGDLAQLGEQTLVTALGKAHGRHLAQLAAAIDDRPVDPQRGSKSIGHEETFARDLHGAAEIHLELVRLSDAVASRLRKHGTGARTLTLKLRFNDFTTITRAVTVPAAVDTGPAILASVSDLLDQVDLARGVRLVGITTSNFAQPAQQLSLDALFDTSGGASQPGPDVAGPEWDAASDAIDEIRSRFGAGAIGPASVVSPAGLRVVRRGSHQWGPSGPS